MPRPFTALLAAVHSLTLTVALGELSIDLTGQHAFRAGDDPTWAAAGFDDSAWDHHPLPSTWQENGVPLHESMGWHRIRFDLPATVPADLAVALGSMGECADEVYLNGQLVAGSGQIDGDYYTVPGHRRVYPLPEGFLRPGQTNVLAVRILRFTDAGGIVAGPLAIAPQVSLELERARLSRPVLVAESIHLTVLLGTVLVLVVTIATGRRPPELLWLLALVGTTLVTYLVIAPTGLALGLVHHISFRFAGGILCCAIPIAFAGFAAATLGFTHGRWLRAAYAALLVAGTCFTAAPGLFHPASPHHVIPAAAYFLFYAATAVVLVVVSFHTLKATGRHTPGAAPLAVAILFAITSVALYFTGLAQVLGLASTYDPLWIGLLSVGFVLSLVVSAAVRLAVAQKRVTVLSSKILTAQDEERKRLARDLHDGVAQSLQSIKIKSQLAARASDRETPELDELVDDVSHTIQELRLAARELRPKYLDDATLTDTMRWYADNLASQIDVHIDAPGGIEEHLRPAAREQLFRIFQESLGNALRHGGARNFNATLEATPSHLSARFTDDGSGFDPARHQHTGLGLASMAERAQLLGGATTVSSAPGQPTTVHVELPLRP